jgi:cytoskeletal protein RodZ
MKLDRCLWLTSVVAATFLVACGDGAAPKPDPNATTKPPATATSTASTSTPGSTATATAASTTDPAKTGAPVSTATPTTTAAATATATAVATAEPDVKGEEKAAAAFSAYLSAAGKYKAGSPGAVTAVLNALGEYKVNPDYPIKFTLNAAPAGVTFGETVLRNANKGDKRATISVPFTPDKAGTHTISGVFSIGVCVKSSCTNEKVPLSVAVKVE